MTSMGRGTMTAALGAMGVLFVLAACGSSSKSGFDDGSGAGGGVVGGSSSGFGTSSGGAADAHQCQGLECQVQACGGGPGTTITGTAFAPNGTLPLYDVVVYVPNSKPDDLAQGVTCDQCGAVTGNPVTTALSDATGKFTLQNAPAGDNIPLVLQVGKWRRQVTIPHVAACTENAQPAELTRLPKNQKEGNMPHIALTTGGCDLLGCVLPKIGVDASEFGHDGDGYAKAVHVYTGGGGQTNGPDATSLWNDLTKLKTYDMAILSCECSENLGNKGGASGPAFDAITQYMNAGGRIFTSDFMYSWYRYTKDINLKSAVNLRGGAPPGGDPMTIDTSFPKGKALGDWLTTTTGAPGGTVSVNGTGYMFGNVISVDASKAQQWASSSAPNAGPRVFTVNTPAGVPASMQCGKGVHLDVHVNSGQNGDKVDATYPTSCSHPMLASEHLLAFFFFDLASCIQNDSQPPMPPPSGVH